MTNQQAINEIKTILNQNISQRESRSQAEMFAMSLGLTFSTSVKMVREIENEESWYGSLFTK